VRRLLFPVIGAMLLWAMPAQALADASPSPSPSPSATASPSAAPSASPSAEATPTPEPSPNPSPTSVAPTPEPSPSASPSPSPSESPSPTPNPQPSGSPTPGQSPATTPPPTPPPDTTGTDSQAPTTDVATQRLIDQVRQQLGGGVANALATVQRLTDTLDQNTAEQDRIEERIQASQDQMDALDDEISRLDDDIATTQDRVDTERAEVGVLARALYQEPDSLLLRLLRAGSLSDLLTQTSDLTKAAVRADVLKGRLSSDLAKLQQDQADRQQALQRQQELQDQLSASLDQFSELAAALQDTSDQLQSVIDDGQAALDDIDATGVAAAQQAAAMLQQRERELVAAAEDQVWQQAQLWASLNDSSIPVATTFQGTPSSPAGTRFGLPIQGAVLTQGFGPTDLSIEPAMFGFTHFHSGLDLASANTRVGAAADGVVAAVGHGTTGYGNYVILVHGGGLLTLYGHLAVTTVKVGDHVAQGQQLGIEGTTGNSTGVHLHFEVRLNGIPVDPSPYLPRVGAA
jgi:murein DD-endopeptidase MepM/ murein hydrolase activator NlpD